jgi:hypothetical protein
VDHDEGRPFRLAVLGQIGIEHRPALVVRDVLLNVDRIIRHRQGCVPCGRGGRFVLRERAGSRPCEREQGGGEEEGVAGPYLSSVADSFVSHKICWLTKCQAAPRRQLDAR